MITNVKVLNDLLNRACDIITSLEGYAEEVMTEYQGSYTQEEVDGFFNEIDMLNEDDRIVEGQYMDMYKDTDPDLEAQSYEMFGEKKV